ncbi:MAG: hypothetical protein HYY06_11530 [Deltaproteobacteria bacterium]|nr:hypothetical protein [Deltaproteobacteria bacterium]
MSSVPSGESAQVQGSERALSRIYREKRELEWVPAELRRVRWLAWPIGAAPVGSAAAVAFATLPSGVAAALMLGAGAYLVAGGLGLGWLADRQVLRRIVRRRVERLAGGELDLRSLRSEKDGELVHVRGRVEAIRKIRSVIDPDRAGVFRRLRQNVGGTCVLHEDAEDFWLVDETGERTRVDVQGGRLVVGRTTLPWRDVDHLTYHEMLHRIPPSVVSTGRVLAQSRSRLVHMGEILVEDGARVTVLGHKSRVPDFTIEERLARETPMRTTLRGGSVLPLVVAPLDARPTDPPP